MGAFYFCRGDVAGGGGVLDFGGGMVQVRVGAKGVWGAVLVRIWKKGGGGCFGVSGCK